MNTNRAGTLDWFVQKKQKTNDASSAFPANPSTPLPSNENESHFDVNSIPHDPGLRKNIITYHPNVQDKVRREYIQRGPCQPRSHDFAQTKLGGKLRRFNPDWFGKYNWLEYSINKDVAFCFVCYLFNQKDKFNGVGGDAFIRNGFKGWNRPNAFDKHVGGVNSIHNQSREKFESLMKPKTSIQRVFNHQSSEANKQYRSRLLATLNCLRFLLHQGSATRGHDENQHSSNRGNFLELLEWLAKHNENIEKVVLENAPQNHKLTAPSIQRDLINSCAKETTKAIIRDIGEDYFTILVDESSDVSHKEQMSLYLRYVDKKGDVVESFLGIVHVTDTCALTLRDAIHCLLSKYSLSPSRIRGQGYDGASNMKGGINGLKTLILRETQSAYYIHCFAHQLQLTLVAVSKKSVDCGWLFENLTSLLNVIGVSCKRIDMLKESQAQKVAQAFDDDELESGKGLNQELGSGRPGDTRWGSHYKLILNAIALYPTIRDVLDRIGHMSSSSDSDKLKAEVASFALESFDFIFMAHLMKTIFGLANELNVSLQRKDQDIVNAMSYVKSTKEQLQQKRDHGWQTFLNSVIAFCTKNEIEVPDMESLYVPLGRKKRGQPNITNDHHFRVEVFYMIIDLQLQELNTRFDEISTTLLVCTGSLSPINAFAAFDKQKLLQLAEFYPQEFSSVELLALDQQLDNYIHEILKDENFAGLKNIGELSKKLVASNKHKAFRLVYLLIKLVLTLPVATASVERGFSAMNFVKNKLRNNIGDQMLNDSLVTFIEKDVFSKVSDDDIMNRFQRMQDRRGQL